MVGRDLAREVTDAGAARLRGRGRPAHRRAGHRHQALDHPQLHVARRDARALPLHDQRRGAAGPRPRRLLPRARPGRPGGARTTSSTRSATLLRSKPVFGICLGHQLLSRAAGLETFKLPFGHRGANHPVKDLRTGRIAITSQNHGFAVAGEAGRADRVRDRRGRADARQPLRRHDRGHPRARRPGRLRPVPPGGRPGAERLARPVRRVHRAVRACRVGTTSTRSSCSARGPIVIGQAAEFDYSGAQACKVLLEEGYEVVLVNSNPATIMTDPEFATATYVEPLLPGPGRPR